MPRKPCIPRIPPPWRPSLSPCMPRLCPPCSNLFTLSSVFAASCAEAKVVKATIANARVNMEEILLFNDILYLVKFSSPAFAFVYFDADLGALVGSISGRSVKKCKIRPLFSERGRVRGHFFERGLGGSGGLGRI